MSQLQHSSSVERVKKKTQKERDVSYLKLSLPMFYK